MVRGARGSAATASGVDAAVRKTARTCVSVQVELSSWRCGAVAGSGRLTSVLPASGQGLWGEQLALIAVRGGRWQTGEVA